MVTAARLFEVADREGIVVEWRDLQEFYLGIYVSGYELVKPYIALNRSLIGNSQLLKCVLAHEIGHHYRTAGQIVMASTPTQIYRFTKYENLADDWAVDKLVPGDEFLKLLQKQFTFWEMVDYFDVVPEFVVRRAKRIYENGLTFPELKPFFRNDVFRVMG